MLSRLTAYGSVALTSTKVTKRLNVKMSSVINGDAIETYLEPTQDAGRIFIMRQIQGRVLMLNLLRFREVADYGESPELQPAEPISGAEAFQLYMDHTLPFLTASGGKIIFLGKGGHYLIGPMDEKWDLVMLIEQSSVDSFLAFAGNQEYLKGLGHRTAVLLDSRLLPLEQLSTFETS